MSYDFIPAQKEQELREVFMRSKRIALDILGFSMEDRILKKKIESSLPDVFALKDLHKLGEVYKNNKSVMKFISFMLMVCHIKQKKEFDKEFVIEMANQKLINEAEYISGNAFCLEECIRIIKKYESIQKQN